MTLLTRKFGVEIEFVGVSESALSREFVQAGIRVYGHSRNATRENSWRFHGDGSVRGQYANELVSPPLVGEAGFQDVMKVAKIMAIHGGQANATCGLHVHVDASGLTAIDMKNMMLRYLDFEDTIDRLMPHARRGTNNVYCNSMKSIGKNIIQRYSATGSPQAFVNEVANRGRYFKLNLCSYLRHGTVEFRQHAGTTNGEKIVNWIKFCLNFVETSRVPTGQTRLVTANSRPPRTLQHQINLMKLLRAEIVKPGQVYATMRLNPADPAIREAMGLAESTIYRVASTLTTVGFPITRMGNGIRPTSSVYRMIRDSSMDALEARIRVNYAAYNAIPVQEPATALFTGLPVEVASFYNERLLEMAA